jgi:hypothetical protein
MLVLEHHVTELQATSFIDSSDLKYEYYYWDSKSFVYYCNLGVVNGTGWVSIRRTFKRYSQDKSAPSFNMRVNVF